MDDTIGGSGHTLEQLSAYLDRGRTPRIAAIDDDAECRALLASMERLSAVARAMSDEDSRARDADDAWYDRLLTVIQSEVRAGRDLALDDPDARTSTTITEGALRELVRRAGDGVGDVLVGSVRLDDSDGSLDVQVSIGVRFGVELRPTAALVRDVVFAALAPHSPLPVGAVDVIVDDVFPGGAA